MIHLLVRKFVKNYENIEDAKVRTDYGVLASGQMKQMEYC